MTPELIYLPQNHESLHVQTIIQIIQKPVHNLVNTSRENM